MPLAPAIISTDFPCSGRPVWATATKDVFALDISSGIKWQQKRIPYGTDWQVYSRNNIFTVSVGVQTVTGLDTDNTDPANPIIKIAVDGVTITGLGTPGSPLVATPSSSGVNSVTDDGNGVVVVDNTDPANPVITFNGVNVDGVTITGDGSSGNPLVAVIPTIPDASDVVKGITKLSVAPVSPTDPIAVGDNDPRNSDARTPLPHAASHVNGTDDIQDATALQKGLLTAADWTTFNGKLTPNAPIVGATKTKITYDTNGLVTAGADATTSDIAEGSNLYFTDERAQDAIGGILVNSETFEFTYNDGTPSISGRVLLDFHPCVVQLAWSPTDAVTNYFGGGASVAQASTTGKRIKPKAACKIVACNILWGATSTAGSNENISIYIRVNDTTDYLVATVGNTDADKQFLNLSMNGGAGITLNGTTDYWMWKVVPPTWSANPTSVQLQGGAYYQLT